jgi:hypothetical protein
MENMYWNDFRRVAWDYLRFLKTYHEVRTSPPDDQNVFYDYLTSHYRLARDWGQLAHHFFAVGLASYGHTDVFDDILDTLPREAPAGAGRGLWAGAHLNLLVPFPDSLSAVRDTEAVREWIRDNRDRLRWNETRGVFEIEKP